MYSTAVGVPQPTNPQIDATFRGAALTNFCSNPYDSVNPVWCFNGPVNKVQSSLTFKIVTPKVPVGGTICFGVRYATTIASEVALTVDGLVGSLPNIVLPRTSSNYAWAVAVPSKCVALVGGKHTFTVTVVTGNVRMDEIVFSTNAITAQGGITTTVAPSVSVTVDPNGNTDVPTDATSDAVPTEEALNPTNEPVAEEANTANKNTPSNASLTPGAIAGIAIAGVIVLVIIIVVVVRATTGTSKATKKETKDLKNKNNTPAVKKMADQ